MKALITGGTGGIGRGVAFHLAERGWQVTIVGRNKEQGQQIATQTGGEFIQADLSLMAEVNRVAAMIEKPLDSLVMCAGGLFTGKNQNLTSEGLELTFALNYLSRFALSQRLLPKISPGGSIVIVSGTGSYMGVSSDWPARYTGLKAAFHAALAVDVYAAELARRTQDIRVHTCYPGMVKTNLMHDAAWPMRFFVKMFGASAEQGSAHLVRLVTEQHDGIHWKQKSQMRFSTPLPAGEDAIALWNYSEQCLMDILK